MTDGFVSASVHSRRPIVSKDLRHAVRRRMPREMRHALSVPLIVMGGVSRVVTLSRAAERPFSAQDAQMVEALAGIALLCLAMSSGGALKNL